MKGEVAPREGGAESGERGQWGGVSETGEAVSRSPGLGKVCGCLELTPLSAPLAARHSQSHWAPAELSDGNAGSVHDGTGPHLHLSKDGKTQSPRRSSK